MKRVENRRNSLCSNCISISCRINCTRMKATTPGFHKPCNVTTGKKLIGDIRQSCDSSSACL